MYNLLHDPAIPVEEGESPSLTLPAVLAALSRGGDLRFPGLAAHQRQAWFCFLVQLAALALTRAGRSDPPEDEAGWRALLTALAGADADTAFALVVEDVARPALLQPPVRDAAVWAKFRGPVREPDAIDILNVAKNHDVKMQRAHRAAPHLWLYALVTLQTQQGFFGRGNYGIARMNGGFSSRVFADRRSGTGWGAWFRRDLTMLLDSRAALLDRFPDYYEKSGGLGLVWLEPWDAETPLSLEILDPFFIEVCRRVRLVAVDGEIGAMLRPSETARIAAAAAKGNLGDPWAPVDPGEGTALTISAAGFDYRRICQILGLGAGLPPALKPGRADVATDMVDLAFSVLVRGQGRTDGLHERHVPIARPLADRLADPDVTTLLQALSKEMLSDVGKGAAAALRNGLRAYLQGAPDSLDFTDERARTITDAFDRDVDAAFLPWLFRRAAGEADAEAWQRWLREAAEQRLMDGLDTLPVPTQRREKARVAAERTFYGMLRKWLPQAFETSVPKEQESRA